ncbi:MAG: PD40 domain-containing protein [Bacteroidales bacterium]|nr:PD40 domain-containing protein [Bacteroidales bacterium]
MIIRLPIKMSVLPVLLLLSFPVEAQKIIPDHEDIYSEAEEYMLAGEYKEALPLYINLCEKGYITANISFKIGECYLNIQGQKDKAIPYLEKAIGKISPSFKGKDLSEENAPFAAYLYLGIAYRLDYKFEKARDIFRSMLTQIDTSDHQSRLLLEHHIDRCNNAEDLMRSPSIVSKDRLPKNINDLYSTSNALTLQNEERIFYISHLKFYDALMQSEKTEEGWQNPINITPLIKSDGDHLITGISTDGNTIILAAYDPYKCGELFSSQCINGKWLPITKLNHNINSIFNETHGSLSSDGKTLFFTSDRKGGFGGLDLYKSEITNGDWGPPSNLGPIINSVFDEESPFLTPDGKKLFFSSQGHYNMGGFDIFYSEKNNDTWLSPVNIGYPVNTPDDDLFFYPVDSGSIAYMSITDKEIRQSEIYRIMMTKYADPLRYTIVGKIDMEPGQKLRAGEITVTFIEKQRSDTIASQVLDNEGRYSQKLPQGNFKLNFSDKSGTLFDSREIDIPYNFPQDQFVINARISLPTSVPIDTFCLENILFAFDKSYIPEQSISFLNALVDLMTRYPETSLQITGFTDALGKEDYNLRLSYNRARAVADFLQQHQITLSRLIIKGLGESMPIAMNSNPDGTDNPEGRKYNRRVELQFTVSPENWIIIKEDLIPDYLKYK